MPGLRCLNLSTTLNDVSFDTGQKDYKDAMLAIQSVFHGILKPPCIVIVAHMRKPGRDNNGGHRTGRELLHQISGSLALGSDSRTVFSVQPASHDLEDDRIVFEIAKANDCGPEFIREYGARTAWRRANAAFSSVPDFDWQAWDNHSDTAQKLRNLDETMILAVMNPGETIRPSVLAKAIKTKFGKGESTVMHAIGQNTSRNYLAYLFDRDAEGLLTLKVNGELTD